MNLKGRYQSFTRSNLVKNATKLLSASVIAQAIGILIYPILTRIYSPEDFGLLNHIQSIGGFLAVIATAEYQYAILLPKEEKEAISCFRIGLKILLFTFILLLCTIPFSKEIAHLLRVPELEEYYWALPLFTITTGGWSLLNYWHTRHKNYTSASTYQVSKSTLNAALKWGLGLASFCRGGLILATIISSTLSLIINAIRSKAQYPWKEILHLSDSDKNTAIKYINFPKFSLPKAAVNYISCTLPFLMLTPVFGLKEMGYYGMATALAFTPINLLYNAINQVLFQEIAAKVNNKESVIQTLTRFIRKTLIFAVPLFIMLYLLLPYLTEIILGEGWGKTGVYIGYMLPLLLTSLIAGSTCFLTDIFMKQKIHFYFEIWLIIVRIGSILYGIHINNLEFAIIGFCLGGFVINSIQAIWYMSLAKQYEERITKH